MNRTPFLINPIAFRRDPSLRSRLGAAHRPIGFGATTQILDASLPHNPLPGRRYIVIDARC